MTPSLIIFGVLWLLWILCLFGLRDMLGRETTSVALVNANNIVVGPWPSRFSRETMQRFFDGTLAVVVLALAGLHFRYINQVQGFCGKVANTLEHGVEWIGNSVASPDAGAFGGVLFMIVMPIAFVVFMWLLLAVFVLLPPIVVASFVGLAVSLVNKEEDTRQCPFCHKDGEHIESGETVTGGCTDPDTQCGQETVRHSEIYRCSCTTRWRITWEETR